MVWLILLACLCGLGALYIWIVAGKRPYDEDRWLTAWLYAHRGLHDEKRPENSMGAFEAAAAHGYGIELDVRISSDDEVVVFHDDDLRRMTGQAGSVETTAAETLTQMQLSETNERIPALKDVLALVNGRVPLLVEIKSTMVRWPRLEEKTLELLRQYRGRYALQSFSPMAVWWYRKNDHCDLRGQLSSRFSPRLADVPRILQFLVQHLLTDFLTRPNFISYEKDGLKAPVLRLIRLARVPVLAWTVRSAKEAEQAAPLCSTIIFEGFCPDVGKFRNEQK